MVQLLLSFLLFEKQTNTNNKKKLHREKKGSDLSCNPTLKKPLPPLNRGHDMTPTQTMHRYTGNSPKLPIPYQVWSPSKNMGNFEWPL